MAYVHIDDEEVLDDMSLQEIAKYVKEKRATGIPDFLKAIDAPEVREGPLAGTSDEELLMTVYLKLRGTEQIAELREYIWRMLGRIL